jgi:adenosylmethionine-8-amino-7-oxononanoate aminotransferase
MSHVLSRVAFPLPTAVSAEGVWITDSDGKRYIDASGGAIVVNIGHGDPLIIEAMLEQARRLSYVHGNYFTTDALEAFADALAPRLPMDDPLIYPVSGGSEAVETAFKMARAFHIGNGEGTRHKIISRWGSYHGNTRGALDASGREPLRAPYLPWLDKGIHVPRVYEYRCELPGHPVGCGKAHAEELARTIEAEGPETVAAFIAEPVGGATLGATVPPPDYWPAIAEVCERYGVLVIADEVMTGFGRTGVWFGVDNWKVRPDILTSGKGCSAGYWPLGLAVATGRVGNLLRDKGFVHGFTYSHHAVGAAVGTAVLGRLEEEDLVEAGRAQGEALLDGLREALGQHANVGDIRGLGPMMAVEFVRDRSTKEPFPRAEKVTERLVAACKERGLLVYSGTGCADGKDGDLIMFGPPFILTRELIDRIVEITADAVGAILPA